MATLNELRNRAWQRANMQYDEGVDDGDKFVTLAETNDLINTAYKELYGHLIRHGMHRSETSYTVTADGSALYALPDDMWAILSVHIVDTNGSRFELKRHDHRHRPDTGFNSDACTYRVIGIDLELSPIPTSGTYEVRYVPIPLTLANDDDEVDGVLGWEEYVVLWVASRLLKKEGSIAEANACEADKAVLLQRIQDEAQAAELSNGTTIANTRWGAPRGLPGDWTYSYRPRSWF